MDNRNPWLRRRFVVTPLRPIDNSLELTETPSLSRSRSGSVFSARKIRNSMAWIVHRGWSTQLGGNNDANLTVPTDSRAISLQINLVHLRAKIILSPPKNPSKSSKISFSRNWFFSFGGFGSADLGKLTSFPINDKKFWLKRFNKQNIKMWYWINVWWNVWSVWPRL